MAKINFKTDQKILKFINDFRSENHYGPTMRTIQKGVGIKHISGLAGKLKRMERCELVKNSSVANAIEVTDKGQLYLESLKGENNESV